MNKNTKQLSNPFSTGSGGAFFENLIQAKFVTLMLTGGYAPCLPIYPIKEIKLQTKIVGYHTDDLLVTVENPTDKKDRRKLLGQIKHTIKITKSDKVFAEVIQAAWSDFNNSELFSKGRDVIALITGPISKTDIDGVNFILEQARHTSNFSEFETQVNQVHFSSDNSRNKRDAFRSQLEKANEGKEISDDDFFQFLKHFHLLGYDLDKKGSVISSLLHSHISQFNKEIPSEIWSKIIVEVQQYNQNAGTITLENIPEEIKKYFESPIVQHIPRSFIENNKSVTNATNWLHHEHSQNLALANLFGSWDENSESDVAIVTKLIGEDYKTWLSPKSSG